jgi:disulfide bond formation protein DsbB
MLNPTTRTPWALVLVSALAREATALYFQLGLELDPCVLCVYQRSAVFGIALGGLIGLIAPRLTILRLAGYLAIGGAALLGLRFALQHVAVLGGQSFDCSFLPDFPTWLPLHEWLPVLFQPTGMCDEIDWSFLGFTMPEVMVAVFAAYLAALAYGVMRELGVFRRRGA